MEQEKRIVNHALQHLPSSPQLTLRLMTQDVGLVRFTLSITRIVMKMIKFMFNKLCLSDTSVCDTNYCSGQGTCSIAVDGLPVCTCNAGKCDQSYSVKSIRFAS